ncbi:MAG: flagellar basal body rod C-terminal domain-containing protein [Nitrospirales bacterium]
MFAGISSSLSGLTAAQTKINTAANNIANANTPEFKKSRTISEDVSSGGVQVSLDRLNGQDPVALQESTEGLDEVEFSNVNLEEELISVLSAQRSYESNLNAIALQDEALGSLLDILE